MGHGKPGGGGAGGPGRHGGANKPSHGVAPRAQGLHGPKRPPMRMMTTTLWEYPSQHYDAGDGSRMQGDKNYIGATPSWVIWQLLQRYTREGDLVVDPMVGSGTTIDVCKDLKRRVQGFDLNPQRTDIVQNDSRSLPLPDETADFVFIDPPYSTHVDYSDDPRCIGKLDAAAEDESYFEAMGEVIEEMYRVMKNRRYMALYVSDSFKKGKPDRFLPIGFALFEMLAQFFKPVDIICVVRHNQKLQRGNWHKAAEEGNFFLRGFNYLFIMKKEEPDEAPRRPQE